MLEGGKTTSVDTIQGRDAAVKIIAQTIEHYKNNIYMLLNKHHGIFDGI